MMFPQRRPGHKLENSLQQARESLMGKCREHTVTIDKKTFDQ
ncbi:MAG: hypothetical protein RIK87_27055 [Fuerstiella sp.]